MQKQISNNEAETLAIAKEFAQTLNGGEVILLSGDLGAGKSVFVRGVAQYFNIKKRMTSPTFVLYKVYDIENNKIERLVHVDAYRVEAEDLLMAGLNDYFHQPRTVVMVEWGEKLQDYFKEKKEKVTLVEINLPAQAGHSDIIKREINIK